MSTLKITVGQKEWLKKHNKCFYSYEDMKNSFNKVFNTNVTYDYIMNFCRRNKLYCNKFFTEEQLAWIQENIKDCYLEDFAKMFNKKFNQNRKAQSFAVLISKGIIKREKTNHSVKALVDYAKSKKLTEDQLDWLNENRTKFKDLYECRDAFNKKFNTNKTYKSMTSFTIRYDISGTIRRKRFTLEEINWCSENHDNYIDDGFFNIIQYRLDFNKKFNRNLSSTAFHHFLKKRCKLNTYLDYSKQQSHYVHDRFPLGHETLNSGVWYVKVNCDFNGTPRNHLQNYRKKANVVYEQYHNVTIDDKKDIVIFLNSDYNDFSKDNLALASKNDIRKYYTRYINKTSSTVLKNDKQLRRIALLSVQLENKIKEIEVEEDD